MDPLPRPETIKNLKKTGRFGGVRGASAMLFRRKLLVAAAVGLLFLVSSAGAIALMRPLYVSRALIRIDQPRFADRAQPPPSTELVESEVGVLRSRDLAYAVAAQLHLDSDDEFAHGARAEQKLEVAAARVMDVVEVNRDRVSYVIAIKVKTRDPLKSTLIAQAYVDNYLKGRIGSQIETPVPATGPAPPSVRVLTLLAFVLSLGSAALVLAGLSVAEKLWQGRT